MLSSKAQELQALDQRALVLRLPRVSTNRSYRRLRRDRNREFNCAGASFEDRSPRLTVACLTAASPPPPPATASRRRTASQLLPAQKAGPALSGPLPVGWPTDQGGEPMPRGADDLAHPTRLPPFARPLQTRCRRILVRTSAVAAQRDKATRRVGRSLTRDVGSAAARN